MKKLVNLMLIGTLTTLCSTGCTALIAGGVIGAGATVAADSRTAGAMVDDESIEIKSGKYLSNNREIYEKSKLEATSVNGNVLLTGQCLDQEYIDYIVQRVSAIPKVKRVINRIEKIEPLSLSDRSHDTWVTTKVKTQLLFGEKINSGRFKVVTENSVVYLIGIVNHSEANRAINVVREIDGVKKVVPIFEYYEDAEKAEVTGATVKQEPASPVTGSDDRIVIEPVTQSSSSSGGFTEDNSMVERTSATVTPLNSSSVNTGSTAHPVKPMTEIIEEDKIPTNSAPASSSVDDSNDMFIIE